MKKMIIMFLFGSLIFSGCMKQEKEDVPVEEQAKEEIKEIAYGASLFDDSSVHRIDVTLADEDWQDLLDDPSAKTKYNADITIDGETFRDVSFSTKGNSSLIFVALDENSSRYSFKVNFSKNNKEQTYHGLDKLSLNNLYHDPTFMRDHLCYMLFDKMGVASPATSYVLLYINGEERGLYMACEDVEKGFLKRQFDKEGVIYKPECAGLALDMESGKDILNGGDLYIPEPKGADLVYIDDQISSYPDIFENAQTHSEDEDKYIVIGALKKLNEKKNLEEILDTDEVITYFALQSFVQNYDSYIGPMLHNYYLYEKDGRLSILPWDYNLAFGRFSHVDPGEYYHSQDNFINCGIDTPLISTKEGDRPLFAWIVNEEEYLNRYHDIYDSFLRECVESGLLNKKIEETYDLIRPYVEKDKTAFYDVAAFEEAIKQLKGYLELRSASVRAQLDGKLASRSEMQKKEDQIDTSTVDLSKLS